MFIIKSNMGKPMSLWPGIYSIMVILNGSFNFITVSVIIIAVQWSQTQCQADYGPVKCSVCNMIALPFHTLTVCMAFSSVLVKDEFY